MRNTGLVGWGFVVGACAGAGSASPQTPVVGVAHATLAADIPGENSVTGHVLWQGDLRPAPPIPVNLNPDVCGRTTPFPALHVGGSGGVQGAVVTLEGVRGVKSTAPTSVTIDQHGCVFVPHVSVLATGGTIMFANQDKVLHNVHAYHSDMSTLFNLASLPGGSVTKTATEPGIIKIQCDVGHTWMLAYVHVVDEPFAAVTDDTGAFHFDHVPPGTYTIHMWHEGWKQLPPSGGHQSFGNPVAIDQKVTVTAGSVTSDFALSAALAK